LVSWKLAFSTLACPDWSLERAIEEAQRWGYEGLELRLIDGQMIEPDLPAADRESIGRLLRESGLGLVAADSSIRLVTDRLDVEVETDLVSFMELAAGWSAPLVRVFGGNVPDGISNEDAVAKAVRILEVTAHVAERLGVKIGLETHDAFSAASAVARVMDRVSSPQVGVVWDVLHTHRSGETPQQVWDLVGPRILSVHIKDARPAPDGEGWQLVLLGDGEVPVRACLDVLQRGGYGGWLVAEWEKRWHPEIEDPDVALPHEIAVLRDWLADSC